MHQKPCCPSRACRRPLFDVLAEALHMISFDVCGVVARYLVSGVPTAGAKPALLMSTGAKGQGDGKFDAWCRGVAVSPDDKQIWVSCDTGHVQAFDSVDGKFLF